MSDIERMTVTLTPEMAATVKGAVATGEYASSSEIVREALRQWWRDREVATQELQALKSLVSAGMEDAYAGRVSDFDVASIAQEGKKRLARRDA